MRGASVCIAAGVATMLMAGATFAGDGKTCKVKISGGLERSFDCKAELRNLGGWKLSISGNSELPVDFGGTILFGGDPEAGRSYTITDLDDVTLSVRDKHDKDANSWLAQASKKASKYGPRRVPAPPGALTLKLTAIGPEPAVHGTLDATLKPMIFNKKTTDVLLSFRF